MVRTAVETAATFHPDVAILDIGMPGMNGYAVARDASEESRDSSVVLVALSGLGQQEDKARAAEAGFDRHFTKPVDVNALRAFLASHRIVVTCSSSGSSSRRCRRPEVQWRVHCAGILSRANIDAPGG